MHILLVLLLPLWVFEPRVLHPSLYSRWWKHSFLRNLSCWLLWYITTSWCEVNIKAVSWRQCHAYLLFLCSAVQLQMRMQLVPEALRPAPETKPGTCRSIQPLILTAHALLVPLPPLHSASKFIDTQQRRVRSTVCGFSRWQPLQESIVAAERSGGSASKESMHQDEKPRSTDAEIRALQSHARQNLHSQVNPPPNFPFHLRMIHPFSSDVAPL